MQSSRQGFNMAGPDVQEVRKMVCASALAVFLTACGGGRSNPPPTPLPDVLSITVPAVQHALGTDVAFSSNALDPGAALTYRWEFGDGASSTLAAPEHGYAKPGVYTVQLTVTNEAAGRVSAAGAVSVADFAIVQGSVCSGAGNTGWCWQRPRPQGNTINDYTFVDDTHGWAVGDSGTILVTTDAGVTWTAQSSGMDLNLIKVHFADAQLGWVAASNGQLLKTTDGGLHWQAFSIGQAFFFAQTLGAIDVNTAWVAASPNFVYLTTDGGSNWKPIAGPGNGYSRLVILSAAELWAVPNNFSAGPPTLAHSLDGGVTWSDIALPSVQTGFPRFLADLQFSDSAHGLQPFSSTNRRVGLSATAVRFWPPRPAAIEVRGGAARCAAPAPQPSQRLTPPPGKYFFATLQM